MSGPKKQQSKKKKRADVFLVEEGLCESREKARRLILAGQVRIGADHVIRKPSELVAPDAAAVHVVEPSRYVSRAAWKLLPAIEAFHPNLAGAAGLDIGASTGGFTDVMLQAGAARVYAVDVGYGQLHVRLRNDPRVVVIERFNARELGPETVPPPIDILTVDVSFISLRKVLPPAARLLRPGAWVFTLIKPQFEAGPRDVHRGGIVKDTAVRRRVVREILDFAENELGWRSLGLLVSPVRGRMGNQEYTAVFRTEYADAAKYDSTSNTKHGEHEK